MAKTGPETPSSAEDGVPVAERGGRKGTFVVQRCRLGSSMATAGPQLAGLLGRTLRALACSTHSRVEAGPLNLP